MSGLKLVLGLALAATLLAAALAPSASEDVVGPTRRAAGAAEPSAATQDAGTSVSRAKQSGSVEVLAIRKRDGDEDLPSAFGTVTATPQKAAPPDVVAAKTELVAAPPQAPPLPFRVLGRYVEGGDETVFLQHAEESIAVHVGDVVTGDYKVESITAGVLTMVYLPLKQRQTLDLGEAP